MGRGGSCGRSRSAEPRMAAASRMAVSRNHWLRNRASKPHGDPGSIRTRPAGRDEFPARPTLDRGRPSPIFVERLKPVRFLSVAFVVTSFMLIYLRGKDYYLFPAYPTMFAVDAVACAQLGRALRTIWYLAAVALALPVLPVVLPILDPAALAPTWIKRIYDRVRSRSKASGHP